jgi:hypothetical protein
MARALVAGGAVVLSLAFAACPSSGPGPSGPTNVPEEQVDAAPAPVDAGPVEPPPPPPSEYVGEPGTLEVTATFNGEPAEGPVEVRRAGQENVEAAGAVSRARTTESFSLPPGRYDVRVLYPPAIDQAADVRENFRVRSGQTSRIDFSFENVSQVTLECKRGGRSTAGSVRLRRPRAETWLPAVRCNESFYISGGPFEAEVTVGSGRGALVITTDQQIVGGGIVRTPIEIETSHR